MNNEWMCEVIDHEWRQMPWREAYPAKAGRCCYRCGTVRLVWT